jgi:hypothetical protein
MNFSIDFHDLGKGWIEQVDMTFEYGKNVFLLELERNQLKDRLESVKSQIDMGIRNNSDKKPTETAISSMIVLDPNYQQALVELYECERKVREAKNIYNTLETRRKALEGLTQLYVAGYFSSKNIELPDIAKTQIQEEQHEKLNKSKAIRRLKNARME